MKKYTKYTYFIFVLSLVLGILIIKDDYKTYECNIENINFKDLASDINISRDKISYIPFEDIIVDKDYIDTNITCDYKNIDEIEVIDVIRPSIEYKKTLTTTEGKKINLLKNVTATDNIDEDIIVEVEGEYDINIPGTYKLTYVAKDSSDNTTREDFTLKVKSKPVVVAPIATPSEGVELEQLSVSTTGNIRSDIVNIARSQIGNYNGDPYWSWYGFSHRVEWCAIFVSWVANQAGVLNSYIPKYAGVGSYVKYFVNTGKWKDKSYIPRPGDLIFFDYKNKGRAGHIGIVDRVENGYVYTVEGNTKHNSCEQTRYSLNSKYIFGYASPSY